MALMTAAITSERLNSDEKDTRQSPTFLERELSGQYCVLSQGIYQTRDALGVWVDEN
jgi:hypothetical protein